MFTVHAFFGSLDKRIDIFQNRLQAATWNVHVFTVVSVGWLQIVTWTIVVSPCFFLSRMRSSSVFWCPTLDCNPWWSHAICSWTSALLWGQVWGAFGSWRGPRSLVSQNPSRNYWPQDGPGSSGKWGERTIINGFALGWTDPRGIPLQPTTGSTRPKLVVDFEPRTTWFAKKNGQISFETFGSEKYPQRCFPYSNVNLLPGN